MTGSQPHPGVTLTPPGYPGKPIDIAGMVRALGVEQLWVVNPFKYKESLAATKEALDATGVRVLISQAPCLSLRIPDYREEKEGPLPGHRRVRGMPGLPGLFRLPGHVP